MEAIRRRLGDSQLPKAAAIAKAAGESDDQIAISILKTAFGDNHV